MTPPTVLVSTWDNGLSVYADGGVHHELAGQRVEGLASDGRGGALAIVGQGSLRQRSRSGTWSTLAEGELELACCVAVGAAIYVGTEDARVFRVGVARDFAHVPTFDTVAGRDQWYAGAALIDGRLIGPPLGVRSMAATCDLSTLLVNVHVGGIPRSADGGATWQPTIDIATDVHQVCAHPSRPNIVAAAAAVGLCISRDGGLTWAIDDKGLHASYCSAVAFAGDDVLVAASAGHFVPEGALYRRSLDGIEPLRQIGGGLPRWLGGIADTRNVAARGPSLAVADHAGNLYLSQDAGSTWSHVAGELAVPSSVFVY
jgi:photosystem II stability/assembly factor-like uncharacterized protein